MKSDMKLRVEDLQVSSFVPGHDGGIQAAGNTQGFYLTCRVGSCVSWDGRICVTKEFGGGDTCESGPYSYC
jgi:hypothetical protein